MLFKKPIVFEMIPGVKMWGQKGMWGATGNYYCGLHEYEEMRFLLDHLTAQDLFVDVGANVGSYTLLAAKGCGARVVAIEPVATTVAWLQKNLVLNEVATRVQVVQKVIGKKEGVVPFTIDKDTTNAVSTKGYALTELMPQTTLDNLLKDAAPVMIKIDVEGYELDVLYGMTHTLSKSSLKWLIIETDAASPQGGTLFSMLQAHQFYPFNYCAEQCKLVAIEKPERVTGIRNFIFCRK